MGKPIKIAIVAAGAQAKKELQSVGKVAESSLGKLGGVAKKAGAGLALAGGVAAVGFASQFSKALDIDDARALLNGQLGLSAKDSEKAGKVAGDLYKNAYGDSLGDVNDVLKNVFNTGLASASDAEASIKGVTEQVLNYSKISGEEALPITRAVSQLLKTGLAKNATEAFDILTRGQQLGIDKSEDLLDTVNEYGTQFRKLGLSGKDAFGLINQMLRGGARDADTAADAIKEFSIRAIDGSKTTASGFKAIGLNADIMAAKFGKGGETARDAFGQVLDSLNKIKDPVKREAAGVALFGTKWEDLGAAIGNADLDTAASSLGTVDGAAKKAGDTINDTARSKMTAFKRGLETKVTGAIVAAIPFLESLGSTLETKVAPKLRDLADKYGPRAKQRLDDLKKLWQDNKTEIGNAADELGEFATNIDTKVIPALARLAPPLQALGKIELKNTVEGLSSINRILSGEIGKGDGGRSITTVLQDIVNATTTFNLPGKLGQVASGGVAALVGKFNGDTSVQTSMRNLLQRVGIAASPPVALLQAAGAKAGNAIISGLGGTEGNLLERGRTAMRNLGLSVLNSSPIGLAQRAGFLVVSKVGEGISAARGVANSKVFSFMTGVGSLISRASPIGLANQVGSKLGSAVVTAIRSGGSAAFGGVASFFAGLPGRIRAAGGNWGGVLIGAGRDMVMGLVNGIRGSIGAAADAAASVASAAINAAKAKLGIKSPSRVFMSIGANLIKGFVLGVNDNAKQARSVTEKLMAGIRTASNAIISNPKIEAAQRAAVKRQRDALLSYVSKTYNKAINPTAKVIDKLALQIDQTTDRLKGLRDARAALATSVTDANSTGRDLFGSDFENVVPEPGAILKKLQANLGAVKAFQRRMRELIKKGFSADVVAQIAQQGATAGATMAAALASATPAQVKSLNATYKAIGTTASQTGQLVAGGMYDAGIRAADGLLAGLKARKGQLESYLTGIANAMVNTLKKALKIKSPSRVFRELGLYTVKGLEQGLDRVAGVKAAARSLANATTTGYGRVDLQPLTTLATAQPGTYDAAGSPVVVNVYALTNGPEVGREVIAAIAAYERLNGPGWRAR